MVTMSVAHTSVNHIVDAKKVKIILPDVSVSDSNQIPASVQCETINPNDGKSKGGIGNVKHRPYYNTICTLGWPGDETAVLF